MPARCVVQDKDEHGREQHELRALLVGPLIAGRQTLATGGME